MKYFSTLNGCLATSASDISRASRTTTHHEQDWRAWPASHDISPLPHLFTASKCLHLDGGLIVRAALAAEIASLDQHDGDLEQSLVRPM